MTDYKFSPRILSRKHFELQTMLLDIRDIVRKRPNEDATLEEVSTFAVARLAEIEEIFNKDESGLV